MQKLFMYLAGRNRQGIKVVAILQGESAVQSRVTDLDRLNLPHVWTAQIRRIVEDNRMLYEPWLESASSYSELKGRMEARGYRNLSMGATPMLDLGPNVPRANTSTCRVRRTMIKRTGR